MKKTLILLLPFLAFLMKGQTPTFSWVKGIGGSTSDVANAIAVDVSGNILTTGYFNGSPDFDPGVGTNSITSAGGSDVFVSKLNSSGNFVWAVNVGGTGKDVGNAITTDAAGNIYVAGSFSLTADFDPGTGTSTMTTNGGTDIFILKLDASGTFVWAKQIGGNAGDECKSIVVDAAGNIYITGFFTNSADFNPGAASNNLTSAGSSDIFICKLDASGNYVWAKNIGGNANDIGNAIALDAFGNVFTTGHFGSSGDFDPGPGTFSMTSLGAGDIFVSKLDASGNFVWAKQMGGTANDVGNGIAVDATGNVYSGGYFFNGGDFDPGTSTFSITSAGVGDIFVSKLDASGNFLWAKGMGSPFDDFAHALTIDAAGNVYTTGFFADTCDFDPGPATFTLVSVFPANPSLVRDQTFISKLDASGNFVWAGAMGSIKGYGIAATTTSIYHAGFFTSTTDFDPASSIVNLTTVGTDDIFIHKMNQGTVGVNELSHEIAISIYPNPCRNTFFVHTLNGEIIEEILIFDLSGKRVFSQKANSGYVPHHLNAGMYLAEIRTGSGIARKKLLVE